MLGASEIFLLLHDDDAQHSTAVPLMAFCDKRSHFDTAINGAMTHEMRIRRQGEEREKLLAGFARSS